MLARTSLVPRDYRAFLDDLKARIRAAQVRAALAVNRELIQLYWSIGRAIVHKQEQEGWGGKVIDRLAKDIQGEFPGIKGFSRANIYRMRAFYLAYRPASPIVARPVRQLTGKRHPAKQTGLSPAIEQSETQIVSQPVRQSVVTIDLKTREFEPEFAGKMNFYLSAVDDRFRKAQDQPSIGLILCKKRSRVIAEYALRHLERPVGVARYVTRLTERLPKALAGRLPTVRQIEAELMELSRHKRRRGHSK